MISDETAYLLISDRCEELVKHPAVRRIMMSMHREGKSIEEIKAHVINMAIATLFGNPYKEVTHDEMSVLRASSN